MNYSSQSVQVGENPEKSQERIRNSAAIYSQRKDVLALKEKLLKMVNNPDYWPTLASFIHGQCSKAKFDESMNRFLTTNEAKALHNELIRSIIYNAHFSIVPPPGVKIPKPAPPQRPVRQPSQTNPTKSSTFQTFTAADLRHIPSINQLSKRIGILLNNRGFKFDSKAANLILHDLKQYIYCLLRQGLVLAGPGSDPKNPPTITNSVIIHVLRNNIQLSSIVSPAVMSKFSIASN